MMLIQPDKISHEITTGYFKNLLYRDRQYKPDNVYSTYAKIANARAVSRKHCLIYIVNKSSAIIIILLRLCIRKLVHIVLLEEFLFIWRILGKAIIYMLIIWCK